MDDRMISVLDYGVGNLGSIINMLRKAGAEAQLATTAEQVATATKVILPGVGSFDSGMLMLTASGMRESLVRRVTEDCIPILGICLGMQMLGLGSEEGREEGLGLVDARSLRFRFPPDLGLKVPHMGWSLINPRRESPLLTGLDARSRFYFVHAYHVVTADPAIVLATSSYGEEFTSMVQQGNVMGAQFHPEKSHQFGMTLLKNFAAL